MKGNSFMATPAFSTEKKVVSKVIRPRTIGGIGFDRLMAIVSCWFIAGTFLDGWAHTHGLVDRTFFTPWHAVLYSGYFANAVVLTAATLLNRWRGLPWLKAIPQGYILALFGVPLFMIAGVGDLIWHTLFGFEVGIEPLLSPTHLLLAFSGLLMISGPLRAIWLRSDADVAPGWRTLLPAVLALMATLSIFTFFTSFAHPVVDVWFVTQPVNDGQKSRVVAGILLQTVLLMGVLFVAMRRWRLPPGSLTLIIAINASLMMVFSDSYYLIPGVLLAGLVADVLFWRLQPSEERVEALRIFAFTLPAVFYLLYFATLEITDGVTWSIHLWLGSIVMAGIVGLLLSYVMVPPQRPTAHVSGTDEI
jgi:hypothetical protein